LSTNCVFPPELDDKQLLLYLDGEVDDETASHLKRCAHCRGKAETLDRLQKRMTTRLYRLTCPPSIELGEYHLRMLPASQMLVVAQHLRECPHCTQEVAQLDGFLSDLAPIREDSLLGKAKVLIAQLVGGQGEFGSAPVVPALRGEAKGPMAFEADGIVITLDVQSIPKGQVSMQGQVAADEQDQWTGAVVQMLRDDMLELTAVLDDLGAFGFEEVRPGPIQLKITSTNGIEVQIPNIDITL
jgi:anti-sigma factor RsiW